MKTAGRHLDELLAKWNLNPDVYKHAVQMLLDVHLETGPAAQVVRYFEIIKEKWPAEEIPFAKIVKVGAAYHEMGEYERSFLVFRATVESSFMRESRVAGFLKPRASSPAAWRSWAGCSASIRPTATRPRPPTPWRSGSTPRRPRRPPTPACAS